MKKVILLTLFGFVIHVSKSQVFIKDRNINADSTIRYFEIYMSSDHSTNTIYSVDYGQRQGFLFTDYIADASGKRVKFRSPMDLLNYITNNGWKLLRRDVVSTKDGPYAFILFERIQ